MPPRFRRAVREMARQIHQPRPGRASMAPTMSLVISWRVGWPSTHRGAGRICTSAEPSGTASVGNSGVRMDFSGLHVEGNFSRLHESRGRWPGAGGRMNGLGRCHGRSFPMCKRKGRNEANWWGKWLSFLGGCWFGPGIRLCTDKLPGPYKVLEGFESSNVHAVGSVNAPLNAEKGIDGVRVGVAEGRECRCWTWRKVRYFGVGGVERFLA